MEKEMQDALDASVKTIKDELTSAARADIRVLIKEALSARQDAEEKAIEKAKQETKGKFKTFGEHALAIWKFRHHSQPDNRLRFIDSNGKVGDTSIASAESKATMVEGTDSTGGFLVFEENTTSIKEVELESSIVLSNGASVIPMRSDTLNLPRVDDSSHVSSLFGGIVMYDEAEGDTLQETEPKWGQCKLTAHKMGGYTKASNELLADNAVGLEAFLMPRIGQSMGWFKDLRFLRGTGSGQALGLMNSPALISLQRNHTSKVVIKDLYAIYSRILPSSRDKMIWIMNHEVLNEILYAVAEPFPVVYATTPAYSATPMFQRNIVDSVAKTILGRPYFVTEKMSALGNAFDIGAFDLSYYIVGERQGLVIDASPHFYFTTDYTAWRFTERFDGQPWLASAITPAFGTATLSPFVALSAAS